MIDLKGMHIEAREDKMRRVFEYRAEIAVINPLTEEPVIIKAMVAVSDEMRMTMKQEVLDHYVHEHLQRHIMAQLEDMAEAVRVYEGRDAGPDPLAWQSFYPIRRVKLEPPYYFAVPRENGQTDLMTQDEIAAYINGKLADHMHFDVKTEPQRGW